MTTSREQRDSFRVHILNAADNTLAPVALNKIAESLEEEIEFNIGDDAGVDPAFIDIEGDAEKVPDIEEPDDRDAFGIEGQNLTGRNIAFSAFKKVENQIVDAYDTLSDQEDQDIFRDYLLKNFDLYFNKFEEDMDPSPEAPDMVSDEETQMNDPDSDLGI